MVKKTSSQQHKETARQKGAISIAVVTVSDSRTPQTDVNGQYLKKEIEKCGHRLEVYRLVKDEIDQVERALDEIAGTQSQIVLFNGGTGISPRDRTFDVISRKFEKVLPGFGEIFRMLSYDQVGAAAMLSRASAGIYRNKVVISTPGSPQAVKLAWTKLIKPELQHLAWELTR